MGKISPDLLVLSQTTLVNNSIVLTVFSSEASYFDDHYLSLSQETVALLYYTLMDQ